MTLLGPKTIRTKLTLTIMVVMGLLLASLGFLIDFSVRRTLMSSVDSELARRGRDFAQGHRRMDGPRPDGPPFPMFMMDGRGPRDGRRGPRFRPPDTSNTRPRWIEAEPRPQQMDDDRPRPPDDKPYSPRAFEISKTGKAVYDEVTINVGTYRVYSQPVSEEGRVRGVVQTAYLIDDLLLSLAGLRNILLTVLVPLGVVLTGLTSLFLVGRLLRPLRMITENAQQIGGSNVAERLPVVGQDEFAGLAKTLNGMLSRLEDAFRLEQATTQRLRETVEQQRRFTADASHELKTPLATIKAHTGLLKMGEMPEEDAESVAAIDTAATRMAGLVNDLLVLARADGGSLVTKRSKVDLAEAVNAAVCAVSPGGVDVRPTPRPLIVDGNGEAITRLFINLLDNAKKYAGTDQRVEVRFAKRGDMAEIAVVDRGVGIAPEHLSRIFDRFYRPDTSRTSETGGTGLGLAICQEIAGAHGGAIEVESKVGKGTTFTVVLPLGNDELAG